jgi:hypothetical protein
VQASLLLRLHILLTLCKNDVMDWIGLDWIGLDWIGLDWIGLDWIGLDWIGLYSPVLSFIVTYCILSHVLIHNFDFYFICRRTQFAIQGKEKTFTSMKSFVTHTFKSKGLPGTFF